MKSFLDRLRAAIGWLVSGVYARELTGKERERAMLLFEQLHLE